MENYSAVFDWENLIMYYEEAYTIALADGK
ncbi:MAG: hypothetical protein ACK5WF_07460 [Cyclobacteriaceae bacterium]